MCQVHATTQLCNTQEIRGLSVNSVSPCTATQIDISLILGIVDPLGFLGQLCIPPSPCQKCLGRDVPGQRARPHARATTGHDWYRFKRGYIGIAGRHSSRFKIVLRTLHSEGVRMAGSEPGGRISNLAYAPVRIGPSRECRV